MMMEDITRCDKCGRGFKINIKEKKFSKGIVERYFSCSHCKHKYTILITDGNIRRLQGEIKSARDKRNKDVWKYTMEENEEKIKEAVQEYDRFKEKTMKEIEKREEELKCSHPII